MSITSGFFNSINHDMLYDAEDIAKLFDGIISAGVITTYGEGLMVRAESESMMMNPFKFEIGTGKAWFEHVWVENDEPIIMETLLNASDNKYRIDRVNLYIDKAARKAGIELIKGTATNSPTDYPSPPADTATRFNHILAFIIVGGAGTDGNDKPHVRGIVSNIGGADCPASEAILHGRVDQINTFNTIQTRFNDFLGSKQEQVNSELNGLKDEKSAEADTVIQAMKDEFNDWFTDLKTTLSAANPAIAIETQINAMKNSFVNRSAISQQNEDNPNTIPSSAVLYNVAQQGGGGHIYPTFADGTDAEITEALQKAYTGEIDLFEDYGWAVGDERVVTLSAMDWSWDYIDRDSIRQTASYHGNAQQVTLVIMDKEVYDLSDNSGKGKLVIGLKEVLNVPTAFIELGIFNPPSDIKQWLWTIEGNLVNDYLSVAYNRFPAYIKNLMKEFKAPWVYYKLASPIYTSQKITIPSIIEMFGYEERSWFSGSGVPCELGYLYISDWSQSVDYSSYYKQLEWYKTSANWTWDTIDIPEVYGGAQRLLRSLSLISSAYGYAYPEIMRQAYDMSGSYPVSETVNNLTSGNFSYMVTPIFVF